MFDWQRCLTGKHVWRVDPCAMHSSRGLVPDGQFCVCENVCRHCGFRGGWHFAETQEGRP